MPEGVFAALHALHAAARAHAARCGVGNTIEPATPVRRLVARSAGRRVRVRLGEVREVLRCPPLARLPGARPWLPGMCALGGRAVAVVDLGALLFDAEPAEGGALLLCGEGATLTALRVDAIEEQGDGVEPRPTAGDTPVEPVDLELSTLLADPVLREPGCWPRVERRPPARPGEDPHAD